MLKTALAMFGLGLLVIITIAALAVLVVCSLREYREDEGYLPETEEEP